MRSSNERRPGAETPPRSWWGRLDAVLVLAAFLGLAVVPAHSQTASGGDPPSRVARLGDVAGQVWIYSDETGEWVTVERNRPLTTGDRLATDTGARAEITLGSTTLRLDAATEIQIAQLDDSRYVVHLAAGSVAARLRSPQALGEFAIDTDEGRFRVQAVGRYRFDRFEQTSEVTVFSGQAAYEAKGTGLPVYTGQHAQFWIDGAGAPQYALVAPARDAFAAWNDERDRSEDRVVATGERFVSPEMTGAEDLGRYGQWQQTPDYGPVWIPAAVPADWAPYTAGHWAYVRPWGWTWVDDAPWGFAPFHYGRWVYQRNAWCWAPGTYVARPVYAPALVAWIGGPRGGVSVSVGGGGPPVGWIPLAPREVYVPSYRASPRYVQQINITHVTNVTNITTIVENRNGAADRRDFANRRFPHAVTFVSAEVMTRRQPVGPAAARLRNDPQLRAFVADARPAPALAAPPVAAPPPPVRPAIGAPPPRPPFEGRTPGAPFERRGPGAPMEGRGPGGVDARPGLLPAPAGPPGRPEFARPADRVGAPSTPVGPGAVARPIGAPPLTVGPATNPAPIGAPATVVGPSTSPPPVGAPTGPAPRPDRVPPAVAPAPAPVPAPAREAAPGEPPPHRMTIPAPVQRAGQAGEPGRVAPALRGRPVEGVAAEPRATPQAVVPRPAEPARAAEVVRPGPAPGAVEPPRPVEAARQPVAEPRGNRPDAQRPRDERRDDRRDDKAPPR